MKRSLISKGKSVNEAIEEGLKILNKSTDEVNIEVLESGKKGVLFLGGKEAKVKLTVLEHVVMSYDQANVEMNNLDQSIEQLVDDLDSMSNQENTPRDQSFMNEDHLIVIKDGDIHTREGEDYYPTIKPGKGIKLYKNGEPLVKTTIITNEDQLTYELEESIEELSWSIDVSEDSMQVHCYIKPEKLMKYQLPDQETDRYLEVKTQKTETVVNHLEAQDLIKKLEELNVIYGIEHKQIVEAIDSLKEGRFIVAQGTEPKAGVNGRLDFNIDIQGQKGKPKHNDDGTVDFRETSYIPSVDKGDVLARLIDPTPGVPGKNVFGDLIPPPKSHEAIVKVGKGIELIEEELVATESGKPQVQMRGLLYKVQILPTLVHEGDVSIETGNIHFTGGVEVLGDVLEEMEVSTVGDAKIAGRVDHANIVSASSIYTGKNVINSRLTAGKGNLVISNLGQILSGLSDHLYQIIGAVKQLLNSQAFKSSDFSSNGILPLLNILLEKKFKDVPPLIKDYINLVKENEETLDDEWISLSRQLKGLTHLTPNKTYSSPQELQKLKEEVDLLCEISRTPPEPNSSISIPYAMNSELYCSGDITIGKDGSYHSDLHAGGFLSINGAIIGGEAYAQSGMDVQEVGSKGGQKTLLSVPNDQSIKAELVRQDTVIQIGKRKYHFQEDRQFVTAVLVEDEIVIK
ncbi:FapA family protein [Alkalibacillus silvisoli]|uniref:RNA-binding protein KhpB N-terminal domain-containing protein n=1 Tax=Alkalibacillus silvisoli TaxID=392823 RepID=A0ABN1A185_9BACI